ncbi:hypothetical protein ACWDA9_39460, partial [Streptomyces sp. NPDC001193]
VPLRRADGTNRPAAERKRLEVSSVQTVVVIAVIMLLIGVAMRWIHVLNARDDARIEAYRFSAPRPAGRHRSI